MQGRKRKSPRRIRIPVRGITGLQRYKRLLLAKRQELSASSAKASAPVPSAGGWRGDFIDQANADAEAELQIRLHQTDGRLRRAIEGALARIRRETFGVCEMCKQPVSKARLELCPGRVSAESERNGRALNSVAVRLGPYVANRSWLLQPGQSLIDLVKVKHLGVEGAADPFRVFVVFRVVGVF